MSASLCRIRVHSITSGGHKKPARLQQLVFDDSSTSPTFFCLAVASLLALSAASGRLHLVSQSCRRFVSTAMAIDKCRQVRRRGLYRHPSSTGLLRRLWPLTSSLSFRLLSPLVIKVSSVACLVADRNRRRPCDHHRRRRLRSARWSPLSSFLARLLSLVSPGLSRAEAQEPEDDELQSLRPSRTLPIDR